MIFTSKKRVLESESGAFCVDNDGILQQFTPSPNNPIIDEVTELHNHYTYWTNKSIKTFVIPDGVKGFGDWSIRGVRIVERLAFPEGLLNFGNSHCIFADCILPSVIIPQTVCELGSYAFGHTHIETLLLPFSIRSPYMRQLKDSYVGTLLLHKRLSGATIDEYGSLHLPPHFSNYHRFYGYLFWPSTRIGELYFYDEEMYDKIKNHER